MPAADPAGIWKLNEAGWTWRLAGVAAETVKVKGIVAVAGLACGTVTVTEP